MSQIEMYRLTANSFGFAGLDKCVIMRQTSIVRMKSRQGGCIRDYFGQYSLLSGRREGRHRSRIGTEFRNGKTRRCVWNNLKDAYG